MAVFRTGRRSLRAPVLLALACAALLPAPVAGAATTTTTPGAATSDKPARAADAPSISLVRQDPLLRLGAFALSLQVRVDHAPTRAAVQVALHESTPSSLGFADAIQSGQLKRHLDDTPVTINLESPAVKRSDDGTFELLYPLQQQGQKPLEATLKLIESGVYALDVRLVRCASCRPLATGSPLVRCADEGCPIQDSFVTWVVAVSEMPPQPVDVAWVWQVAAPPQAVDGSLTARTRDAFSERGRLSRLTAALDAAGDLPLTVAAAGETLTAWKTAARRDAGTERAFSAFRAAIERSQPDFVLAPWVPIDARAIHAAGLPTVVRDAFTVEPAAVRNAIGITPERSTAWLNHADEQTLRQLRDIGVEQVGMLDVELQPIDAALQHQRVSVAGSPMNVLTDDSFLRGLLRGTDPAPLRVQRFVAATALLAYDQPQRRAGVVLATDPEWQPDRALVAAFARAARQDPMLHFTTLDGAFTDVTRGNDGRGGALVRRFSARESEGFAVPATRVQATRATLSGYASLVGDKDPRLVAARQQMLVAMASLEDRDDALARLDAIDASVATFTNQISASTRSVTLTSAKTSIPITFTNRTGSAVRLRVELLSDKIDQPDGGTNVSLPATPINQTVRIPVQVKTSGHFVMSLQMRSIDGGLSIGQPERVTVTSRVFGSFAWLTYGALAFLALWWVHHFLRRRRTPVIGPTPAAGASS